MHRGGAIERGYERVRWLSIDVALAALGAGVMACRVFRQSPPMAFYLLLPLAVWIAYTVDHLLDARRLGETARLARHRFHRRHARTLWICCGLGAIACSGLAVESLTRAGLIVEGVVGVLFVAHEAIVEWVGEKRSPLLIKELGVAVVFTLGTWGLPLARRLAMHHSPPAGSIVMMCQYLLLAMANLLEFSMFEARADARGGQSSFVLGVGRSAATRVVYTLLMLQPPLCVVGAMLMHGPLGYATEGIFIAMASGLTTIVAYPRLFVRNERYRTLGDGLFLLPLITAWFG